MKIKWLAHAAFLITSNSGTRIIMDPYQTTDTLKHSAIKESADIVTMSHDHGDHSNVNAVRGNPQLVRGNATIKGIKIRAIPAAHDKTGGSERGKNTIFCFEVDGVNICHLGDLGHLLSESQVIPIGRLDVLMIPVGGFFTIDATTAGQVCDQLKPKVILPMHYKTDKLKFPITGVDEFLKGKNNVNRLDTSEITLLAGELPKKTQIIVLKPSL